MSTSKYNREYIENLIKTQAEESTYLEFKAAGALNKIDKNKIEITKDISAFANADGGVLIYGLLEENHVATSEDFINGNIFTKEWLQQIIDGIKRKIPGLEIIPIRYENDIERTIYIVDIPRSNEGAHQATDGRFYIRRNFIVNTMQEYEIRDSYNKPLKTELEILEPKINGSPKSWSNHIIIKYSVSMEFSIQNIGKVIEKMYQLEIGLPSGFSLIDNPEFGKHFNKSENGYNIYLFPQNPEIYPEQAITIARAPYLEVSQHNISQFGRPLRLKLYYSSGTKEKEIQILPQLKHTGANGIAHDLSSNCFIMRCP